MRNKKYIFCLFVSTKNLDKTSYIYKNYISEIIKKHGKFTIVNFFRYDNENKITNNRIFKDLYKDKLDIFNPRSKKEFLNFARDKKVLAIDSIGNNLKTFKIRRLINRQNIFLILLMNLGLLSNEQKNLTSLSHKNKKFLLIKSLKKYVYRSLVLFNIFPKTYIYFESRKKIIKNFQNNKIRMIIKKFSFLNFLLNFINIYPINSTAYDNYAEFKKIKKNNNGNIVFIDGNYNHQDIALREEIRLENVRVKYFNQLKNQFNYLKKILNKQIEICLHPSSNEKIYKKYFRNFLIHKGKTREKVMNADIVIFHESSAIMEAIFYNKKILIFETDLFGKYMSDRINFYKNSLKLPSIKIENNTNLTKSKFLKKFKSNTKYKNYFIRNNLKIAGSEPGTKKFIKITDKLIKDQI